MPKPPTLSIYPELEVRRAIERISAAEHHRPLSQVVDLAVRAFVVMYDRDKWAALKLADEFSKPEPASGIR